MNDKIHAIAEENFTFSGEIIHGKHLGRTIGFPTANLECPTCPELPQNGVHIAVMQVHTGVYAGRIFPCVLNQGKQPTAPSGITTVEAHIPDFSGDLYGAQVTITYIRFLRPETKFASLDALKEQLISDTKTACDFFHENSL